MFLEKSRSGTRFFRRLCCDDVGVAGGLAWLVGSASSDGVVASAIGSERRNATTYVGHWFIMAEEPPMFLEDSPPCQR